MTHKLTALRSAKDLTVAQLAEMSGLSESTIYKIERCTSEFRTNEAVASLLAEALECGVYDIFSPSDLSHIGRPPLTGVKLTMKTTVKVTLICMACRNALPRSGICGYC